ncbi:MAG: LuxR C-terminal-related transcriptional regulator [Arenicella sp.]
MNINNESTETMLDEFILGLSEQETLSALKAYFLEQIEAMGYCAFDAYCVRVDTLALPRQKGNFFVASYSISYVEKYIEQGFVQHCPGLMAAGKARLPFDYIDYLKRQRISPSVVWQRSLFLLYNIHHAWLVPLNGSNTFEGVTVYQQGNKKQHKQQFMETRHTIHLMATYFYEALISFNPSNTLTELLTDEPIGSDSLSNRETECLELCARGKTNGEISMILEISENTVRFHIKNIFRKLDVSSRGHAISKMSSVMNLGI